jgi:hypothetical protein
MHHLNARMLREEIYQGMGMNAFSWKHYGGGLPLIPNGRKSGL